MASSNSSRDLLKATRRRTPGYTNGHAVQATVAIEIEDEEKGAAQGTIAMDEGPGSEASSMEEFTQICSGVIPISRKNSSKFLESIVTHPNPSSCLKLVTSAPGIVALKRAMNLDYTQLFYEGLCRRVVEFFRHNSSGEVTQNFVEALIDPPLFFASLSSALWRWNLTENTQESIAWLFLQYHSHPAGFNAAKPPATRLYKGSFVVELLLKSPRNEIREIGEKLEQMLPEQPDAATQEHDNDYPSEEWRNIAVYPTPDELQTKATPHFPVMTAFDEEKKPDEDGRVEDRYLETLFRLYREEAVNGIKIDLDMITVVPDPTRSSEVELADIVFPGDDTQAGDITGDAVQQASTPANDQNQITANGGADTTVGLGQTGSGDWEAVEPPNQQRPISPVSSVSSVSVVNNDPGDGIGRRWALGFRCVNDLWLFTRPAFISPPSTPSLGGPLLVQDVNVDVNGAVSQKLTPAQRRNTAATVWWYDGMPFYLLGSVQQKDEKEIASEEKGENEAKEELLALCTYVRDPQRLAQNPPMIVVQIQGSEEVVSSVLRRISQRKSESGNRMKLRLLSSAPETLNFDLQSDALETVQNMTSVPFKEELLLWRRPSPSLDGDAPVEAGTREPESIPEDFLRLLKANPDRDLNQLLGILKQPALNNDQAEALEGALRQRVSLIQGVTSTGKSTLAALLIKIFHLYTPDQRILLLGNGTTKLRTIYKDLTSQMWVPRDDVMSVGHIAADMTNLQRNKGRDLRVASSNEDKEKGQEPTLEANLQELIDAAKGLEVEMKDVFRDYHGRVEDKERKEENEKQADEADNTPDSEAKAILQYLATHDSEATYHEALRVPNDPPESVSDVYLLERWREGKDAGVLCSAESINAASSIWEMSDAARGEAVERWQSAMAIEQKPEQDAIQKTPNAPSFPTSPPSSVSFMTQDNTLEDAVSRLFDLGHQYNVYQSIISAREKDVDFHTLKSKQIVVGTLNYLSQIREVLTESELPEVVIVMDADEMFECEVLSALGPKTKHLIMFGKMPSQRPSLTTPRLSAGSKKGHNLDISVFERLIRKGYPCHILDTVYPYVVAPPPPPVDTLSRWGAPTYMPPPPGADSWGVQQPIKLRSSRSRRRYANSIGTGTPPVQSRPTSPAPVDPSLEAERVIPRKIGASEKEWNLRKESGGVSNQHVDAIMSMLGLEEVKKKVLDIMDIVELMKKQKRSMKGVTFNAVLFGNSGTGMLAFADYYFKFLQSIGIISGNGPVYNNLNVTEAENILSYVRRMQTSGGGIHVVDAHKPGKYSWSTWLSSTNIDGVTPDLLVQQMALSAGVHAFLFSGPKEKMETWLASNPVLDEALAHRFYFPDLEVDEMLQVFEMRLWELFKGEMKVEGGVDGPYVRLAVEGLAVRRDAEGFANELEVHSLVDDVLLRQAKRLAKRDKEVEEEAGEAEQHHMLITKEDLLVHSTDTPIEESESYKELNDLVGLEAVKATVKSLIKLVQVNNQRRLQGKKPVRIPLNRVFLGPSGTGKTTVAKIFAKLLNRLGLLSTGEVVVRNANDFIGQYIGQSEAFTKSILAGAKGKVLIIDEAHTLSPTSGSCGGDVFKEDVINSLVSGIQNIPGDDQCVLLLGYEDEMFEMFQSCNPGLERRFRLSDAFYFADFSVDELVQIFDAKLKKEDLSATPAARRVAAEMLDRARYRPHFGNGGAVDNMIANAKENYYGRFEAENFPDDILFEPQDFDPDYDRGGRGPERLKALFEQMVGREDIMAKFEEYQIVSRTMRDCGKDVKKVIPMNFIFKGPPGTGKTTIARKMGHIYYDMGLLSSPDVIECSATDMIGSYLGQTGPKTQQLFKKALGKVLFIDEAYRLSHGEYAQEAIGELVTLLTQKAYHMKMVVVLAGYDREMDQLLLSNRGLASRFPEEIVFENVEPGDCLEILRRELQRNGVRMRCLEDKGREYKKMMDVIKRMSGTPAWGNARDMMSLSVHLVREAHKVRGLPGANGGVFEVSAKVALKHLIAMRDEQQERASAHPQYPGSSQGEGEKFNPSAVLEQLNVARWRAVRQQLSGVNSSYSRTQFYDTSMPGP
ncbi:hypothetical protein AAF712_003520 [Marasmius tenuissimus]|uniref:AAA+ ATPase domain-containing protein n=1 Tax=Marasmius tenuissimus TaxID=585030 RepID=A0ABR3A7J5_9AGAR